MNPIVHVEGLSKQYRTFQKNAGLSGATRSFFKRKYQTVDAVKPLSFSIQPGEFVGLLGPNGAGKTTTLKMLTGLIHPTAGDIRIFGKYQPWRRQADYLRQIGMVMGQRNQLNPDLPAIDSFHLARAIYDIEDAAFRRRLSECVNLFSVDDNLKVPVRKLSLGERMKMELILSLLHEPKILFLDEPTIGLDFNAARQIRSFLHHANTKLGVTILLTSHYAKDIEELCRRVIVINQGQAVYDGSLSQLNPRIQGERLVEIALDGVGASLSLRDYLLPQGIQVDGSADRLVSFGLPVHDVARVLKRVLGDWAHANTIADVKITERPLEDVFAELFSRKI